MPDSSLTLHSDKAPAEEAEEDDEFDPTQKQAKSKGKARAALPTEDFRADNCTLKEHHDHLLSASFDLSFNGSGAFDPSSSQIDPGFALDDNFFPPSEGLDFGLGDELAHELGAGWGTPARLRPS